MKTSISMGSAWNIALKFDTFSQNSIRKKCFDQKVKMAREHL